MVDKISSINLSNVQKTRNFEDKNVNKKSDITKTDLSEATDKKSQISKISDKINLAELKDNPPIDLERVSKIKDAISRGDYPIDIERISDALMEAYKDIK